MGIQIIPSDEDNELPVTLQDGAMPSPEEVQAKLAALQSAQSPDNSPVTFLGGDQPYGLPPGSAVTPVSTSSDDSDSTPVNIPGVTPAPKQVAATPVPSIPASKSVTDSTAQSLGAAPKMNPLVAQYLQSKYGMSQAQEAANQNQLYANLARAGGTLAHAMSMDQRPMDESGYNALSASANAPVQNLATAQAYKAKQLQLDQSQAMMDPSSPQSVAFRKSVEQLAPGIAKQYGDAWNQVTAADQDLILKPVELREQIEARKQQFALQRQYQMGYRQDTAYTQLRHDMETFRGNQSVQQAATTVQNANKALALINQYSDPNKIDKQTYGLLLEELGKIASGGVPSDSSLKNIDPNTAQEKLSQLKQAINNDPTGIQAGQFVKENLGYLKEVSRVSQQAVDNYRRNIAKGYRHRVRAEDYNEALSDYGLNDTDSTSMTQAAPTSQPKYKPGTIVRYQGKQYRVGQDGDSLQEIQ